MSKHNEDSMAQWMNDAPAMLPGVDITAAAVDPFAPQTDDDAEWQAIITREQLTWNAELTDDDPTTGD